VSKNGQSDKTQPGVPEACLAPPWGILEALAAWITPELRDSRRQAWWSARGASEPSPSFERRSGAAVRSSDLVRRLVFHLTKSQ